MKIIIAFFITATFISCTKDKIGSTNLLNNSTPFGSISYRGIFYPTSGISVSGVAKVVQNTVVQKILLDSFSVSTGPDLKVYLSQNDYPSQFINLGALQSFSGKSYYSIPNNTNLTLYKYVLIHCQQYNHLFAIAELKK